RRARPVSAAPHRGTASTLAYRYAPWASQPLTCRSSLLSSDSAGTAEEAVEPAVGRSVVDDRRPLLIRLCFRRVHTCGHDDLSLAAQPLRFCQCYRAAIPVIAEQHPLR